jgi:Flp pilus assembly protein TadG
MIFRRPKEPRSGIAATELALVLPFLCYAFLATVDFARVIYYVITIENCAHNAAIYQSHTFDNQNQQYIGASAQYWQDPSGSGTFDSVESSAAIIDGSNLNPPLTPTNVSSPVSQGGSGVNNNVNVYAVTVGGGTGASTYYFNMISKFPFTPGQINISRTYYVYQANATPSTWP